MDHFMLSAKPRTYLFSETMIVVFSIGIKVSFFVQYTKTQINRKLTLATKFFTQNVFLIFDELI